MILWIYVTRSWMSSLRAIQCVVLVASEIYIMCCWLPLIWGLGTWVFEWHDNLQECVGAMLYVKKRETRNWYCHSVNYIVYMWIVIQYVGLKAVMFLKVTLVAISISIEFNLYIVTTIQTWSENNGHVIFVVQSIEFKVMKLLKLNIVSCRMSKAFTSNMLIQFRMIHVL